MRIAILGTRGVPANYGGFETFAEEFGKRLAEGGHEVTVYGRNRSVSPRLGQYLGMRIVRLPAPPSKYLETVVHTLVSAVHALTQRYNVIYVCNSANIPAVILLLLFGGKVVLNVDGLEWKRRKWSRIGRAYYRLCARLAARLPIRLVTDAEVIQRYYADVLGRATDYFPYGTDLVRVPDDGTLARLGLEPNEYILYVSRLEPENNAREVVDAFKGLATDFRLAIVGDAPYAAAYVKALRAAADPRVLFLGGVYGKGYRILQAHAFAYVQATEVGGTHPALVEAMGCANAIVAKDVAEHRETLGGAGLYYREPAELTYQLGRILADDALASSLRKKSQERARRLYSWDTITDRYEAWLEGICNDHRRRRG